MDRFEAWISPETCTFPVKQPFELDCGECLDDVRVAWRSWGQLNSNRDNAVIVNHALTGSADVDSWWPGLLGPGRTLDPQRDYIVCSNLLGSCYGTTGPGSINPKTGRRYGGSFPAITAGDMVCLQKCLTDHLGIRHIPLVVGGSLGGMLTLEWARRYPDLVGAIAPLATAASQSAWAIGFSEAQRQALATDPRWRGGNYPDDNPPRAGLAAARIIAMLSYRHWAEFTTRFGRERSENGSFQSESYLRHQGRKFSDRFDAASYMSLSRTIDHFDIGCGEEDAATALQTIAAPALVVTVDSDLLYPAGEQAFLARHLPRAEHRVLPSPHGHDGFLIDTGPLDRYIRNFRDRLEMAAGAEGNR